MPLHPILRPPNRVSRLYPLMTIALMLGSSSLVYAWQSSQLNATSAVQDRDRQISQLTTQNQQLTNESKKDEATLQTQKTQIDQITTQLNSIKSQLSTATQQLKDANDQLSKQKDQLDSNASELAQLRNRPPLFSFQNQSALADIDNKEADVKSVVTAAYDYVQKLYGQPYLLDSITITFVNSFTIPGASGEILISNSSKGISIDIHLKDFDKTSFEDTNTIIHEMVHAFHGVAVISTSALEEGITVAATDAIMARMIADGKLPGFSHLYLQTDSTTYQEYNAELTVRADNTAFYQDPLISRVYQLIGTAWYKLYTQDPNFFLKFNAAYYTKVQQGQTVDAPAIRDIIASIVPQVGGVPIQQFFSDNQAFTPR